MTCKAGTFGVNSTDCEKCPRGTFSEEGSGSCTPCKVGTVAESEGKASCWPCDRGYIAKNSSYCEKCPSGTRWVNATYCEESDDVKKHGLELCEAGQFFLEGIQSCYYCKAGTFANGTVPLSDCEPCSAGKIVPRHSSSECISCGKGRYAVGATDCGTCPAGTFSGEGAAECTPCQAGFTSRGYQSGECYACRAGTYEVNRTSCVSCPVGTFSGEGTAECSPCQAGYTSSLESSSCTACKAATYEVNRTSCAFCPAGTTSLEGATKCTACPAKYISKSDGKGCYTCPSGFFEVNRTSCQQCPAGTIPLIATPKDVSDCISCQAGYISKSGYKDCYVCESGYYEVNRTDCKKCPPGTFARQGTSGSCTPCEAGKVPSLYGAEHCVDCEPGTITKDSISCERCPDGTVYMNSTYCKKKDEVKKDEGLKLCSRGEFFNEIAQSCQSCQTGTFANGTTPLSECEPCPVGSIAPSFSSSKCIPCKEGSFEVDRTLCASCLAGTFSEDRAAECTPCQAGYTSSKSAKSCYACPAATYEEKRTTCKKCPVGFSAPEGSNKASDCFACKPGHIVPTGTAAWGSGLCLLCPARTYEVNRTSCEKCPAGTTSDNGAKYVSECTLCPAGSIISGSETECKECKAGTYEVKRTSCNKCPAGTTSSTGAKYASECISCPAGSFAKNSTSCEECPAGTFGQDGICTQCPLGKVSLAQGSQDCMTCPSNTTFVNSTYCKEINDVKKDGSEEVPNKGGSNAVTYLLAISLVIVLVYVAISKRNHQKSRDETKAEDQKDMKAVLVHHDESNQNRHY